MSDEELESFSITDRDLDSAFNPTRRRNRQSKEEAIYGIWATSAERASSRPTSSSSSSYGRGYQGIAFVSGGVKGGSNIEKGKEKSKSNTTKAAGSTASAKKRPILLEDYDSDEDSDEKDDDDDDEVEVIEKRRKRRKASSDEEDDDDGGGDEDDDQESDEKDDGEQDEDGDADDNDRPVGSSDDEDERPVMQRQPPNVQYPRSTPAHTAPVRDKDFGAFEKHTKGFGLKMLKKMGFKEGHGLGKNLQGRAIPIQVVKREGKGAIGRYGNEDPNRLPSAQNEAGPGQKSSKKNAGPAVPQWKKQPKEKAPKQQYAYKTFNDVIKEQSTKFHHKKQTGPGGSGQTREKIIDMTGREQRVLSGYDSLSTKHFYGSGENEPAFSLDELTHNLDLVIESCEESMVRSHRRRKFDEDTTVALKYDLTSTAEVLKNEEVEMNRLNILISMINRCEELVSQVQDVADLFFLRNVFDELKRNYHKEYQKYRLWDLAVPVLHHHLKEYLTAEWDILHGDHDHDAHVIDMFRKWRNILEDNTIDLTSDSSIPSKETMDPYHRLIWEVWMPVLRKAMLKWDPRHPDHLIDGFERWLPCLPPWIWDNIRDQLIYPVLQREVEGWDPLTDPIPIHSWLHPWLPLMKDRLEPLYTPIRTKLGQALQGWQPSDASARAVLLPWKPVFQQGTWDAFMNKHIVPKLIVLMQQFIIDPRQQVLEPWHWFMSWHDMIPLPSTIAILEKSFFPQWHRVLNAWLNTNPDYQEIQRWYSGWRSLLPPAVIGHTVIKEKLAEGLMMIDRRLSGPSINVNPAPAASVPPPPAVNINYEALHNRGVASSSSSVVSSFKDLVANKASENNLLFHPIPNRFFEGKQVYRFGKANIYIDKNVLFLYENGHWMPIRLIDLVSKAI